MYVCICNSVTESDIKKAVKDGANSMHHLKTELKCSTQCGGCSQRARACLDKALEKQSGFADITFA